VHVGICCHKQLEDIIKPNVHYHVILNMWIGYVQPWMLETSINRFDDLYTESRIKNQDTIHMLVFAQTNGRSDL
jgi:hypothetical protein